MKSNIQKEEIKNEEDKNIEKLREEFNHRQSGNKGHPKTSHGYKHSPNHYNYLNDMKKYTRYNKALSANKLKPKITNDKNLNGQIIYDFCKKHPGYLYYKEIVTNLKNKKMKKRAYTGRVINRKMKLEPISKVGNKNLNYKYNSKENFPKINNNKNNVWNEAFYNYNYINNNYNYKKNNPNDKNNPYSFFWYNKILNKNDFRIDIKGNSYGVPKLGSAKKDDVLNILNNNSSNKNKNYFNNFISKSSKRTKKNYKDKSNEMFDENKNIKNNKCYKVKTNENSLNKKETENNIINNNKEDNKKNNFNKINNKIKEENEDENESLDEEQQKQFYTNQKNFFKARKDIIEEPEYLEEDNESSDKKI